MNYKLETYGGERFTEVAEKAKRLAISKAKIVEFDFNEIICLVSDKTVLEYLERDYMNAHIMEWKTIGPECESWYSADTEIELYSRRLAKAKQRKLNDEKAKIADGESKRLVDKMVEGIVPAIIPEKKEDYKKFVENNSKDSYSRCCVDYGEQWMKLMQIEIAKGRSVVEIADETQKPLSYMGITGFMYGCVMKTLAHFWQHGEELRKWHNKQYGISEDKKGVVNPAILTIGGYK